MTWAPFILEAERPQFYLDTTLDRETFAHLFLLAPFAAVLTTILRNGRSWRPLLVTLGIVSLVTLVLESGQWWLIIRALTTYDLLAGLAGGALAIGVTAGLMRAGVSAGAIQKFVGITVFVFVALSFNYSVIRHHVGLVLFGWTDAFQVAVGHEVGGSRVYQGEVSEGRICAGAVDDQVCVDHSSSDAERRRLVEAALESQRVELSAQVVSTSDEQRGPKRIVTFSDGPYFSNVMLGQQDRDLIFRIRTYRGGPNGAYHPFTLKRAVSAEVPTRVTATYDRGRVTMTAIHDKGNATGAFRPPFATTLRVRRTPPVQLTVFLWGRALFIGGLIYAAGIGMAVGWLLRGSLRLVTLVAAISVLAAFWFLDVGLSGTVDIRFVDYAVLIFASIAGVILARADRQRARQPDRSPAHEPALAT